MTARKKRLDDAWITTHFEMIVDKYGGKYPYIFVARGKCFPVKPGDNIRRMEEKIRRKFGKPIGMPVSTPEDFVSILSSLMK